MWGEAQLYLLQDVCMRFGASDESRVELVLIQRHIIAVNCLACRLLQSREVHHGTTHHVIHAPPLRHCLEKTYLLSLFVNLASSITFVTVL